MQTHDRSIIKAKIKQVFKSQASLSRLLGDISPMGISQWFSDGRKGVPPEYCPRIARLSNGQLSESDLRPDIFSPQKNGQDAA
ncbi:MAG: YdaS family helix-turn-helix protein [Algoriphagus sp.]